ncbi:hypothetical protein [Amycolatopsis dongchuanensis]|uniref:Antitoxin n=1 Tax=Amycolatopsis dongchuanensis TaxID=1070866 RepID=A0ABP8VUU9_9PSEU
MIAGSLFACVNAGKNDSCIASLDQGQCDTPSDDKGPVFANTPASFPVLYEDRTGGVMQIGEFNRNISAKLAAVVASGAPKLITRREDPYVTVLPHDLFEDLLAAAGKRGKRVLARHQAQAAQRNQTSQEELPLTAA